MILKLKQGKNAVWNKVCDNFSYLQSYPDFEL